LIKDGVIRVLQGIHTDQVFPKIDSIFPSSTPKLVGSGQTHLNSRLLIW